MWFVWLLIGVFAVIAWLYWAGDALCPQCGRELGRPFGAPWEREDHCSCGWRKRGR